MSNANIKGIYKEMNKMSKKETRSIIVLNPESGERINGV